MTCPATPASTLRQHLAKGGLLSAPGICDPYTARIVEHLGFDALYLGGNALGLSLGVGQPFVTLTETVDALHRIGRVATTPIIVDAGAGFGDAAHAAIAMAALSHAGAAAVHVDDQIYPKRAHYHRGCGRLAEMATVAGKLRAMRGARAAEPLLIARTDALRITRSMDAVVERCARYVEAGAEALMVLDAGLDEAANLQKAVPGVPLIWIGGIAEPIPTVDELRDAGYAIAVYPFSTMGAITESVLATWRGMAKDGRPARTERPAAQTVAQALEIVGMDASWRIEIETTEPDLQQPG